jgi:tetratricopeptide (TPR) repeat protein
MFSGAKIWVKWIIPLLLILPVPGTAGVLWPQDETDALYAKRADMMVAKGRYIDAIENYSKAIKQKPCAAAYQNRGYAYQQSGELTAAMADFNRAIGLNPKLAQAYVNRGILYQTLGKLDHALEDYGRAIRINHNLADAYNNRGGARLLKGDLRGAIADFNRVIALGPKYKANALCLSLNPLVLPRTYASRGLAWEHLGNLDHALADFSTSIRLDPDFAIPLNLRGNVRAFQGDYAGAINDYDQALKIDPSMSEALVNREQVQRVMQMKPASADRNGIVVQFKNLADEGK